MRTRFFFFKCYKTDTNISNISYAGTASFKDTFHFIDCGSQQQLAWTLDQFKYTYHTDFCCNEVTESVEPLYVRLEVVRFLYILERGRWLHEKKETSQTWNLHQFNELEN